MVLKLVSFKFRPGGFHSLGDDFHCEDGACPKNAIWLKRRKTCPAGLKGNRNNTCLVRFTAGDPRYR